MGAARLYANRHAIRNSPAPPRIVLTRKKKLMRKLRPFALLAAAGWLALPAFPQAIDTLKVLKGVEDRYNSAKTLQADFVETLRVQGRTRSPEKGTVYLSRPKRTRWNYTTPAGRVFLTDGKYTHDYDPRDNTYQREAMKETEDDRLPLSFLLGNLDFQKNFDRFEAKPEDGNAVITIFPKNQNLAFSEITMTIAPDSRILRVQVIGRDFSTTEFQLSGEQRNIPVPDSMFQFTPPPGTKVIEAGE